AAGIRINSKLGSLNSAVRFPEPVDAPLETVDLAELVKRIGSNQVDAILVLGENPAFTAPADIDLAGALSRVNDSIYLGAYDDETAALCQWQLPLAHPLESWGDVIAD